MAQNAVDEVIVTGSYIKQTPEDAPVPVDVVNSEELFNVGNPSVVELVKTLGVSSGVDGETNQFQSNGLEGTANINLRGLGSTRYPAPGALRSDAWPIFLPLIPLQKCRFRGSAHKARRGRYRATAHAG